MYFHPTPTFKAYIEAQKTIHLEMKLKMECMSPDGDTCSCWKCNSSKMKTVDIDSVENITCEYEMVCSNCNTSVAYWAYGSYDNNNLSLAEDSPFF